MGNILGKLAGNFERKSKLIDIPSFDVSPPLFGDESLLPFPPMLIEIDSNYLNSNYVETILGIN